MMWRYRRAACADADPRRLVAQLLDGTINSLHVAALATEARDIPRKTRACDRALRILAHLRATLDLQRGGEVAVCYDALYVEVGRLVLAASATLDAAAMRGAALALASLLEAWSRPGA